jgi:DNA-binding HxlR family transcriptional regulator
VIGDRWVLLIVRELLLRDCRFTDLRRGLPGIATNLLTERLRGMEAAGILERVDAPPPVATTLYRLTERGRALEPVIQELVRWGMPEMVRGAGDDAVFGHWLAGSLPVFYSRASLDGVGPLVVGVEAGGEALTSSLRGRRPARRGRASRRPRRGGRGGHRADHGRPRRPRRPPRPPPGHRRPPPPAAPDRARRVLTPGAFAPRTPAAPVAVSVPRASKVPGTAM